MQVIRAKHKLKGFAFAAKAPKGCAASLTLALGNNTLEVCSCSWVYPCHWKATAGVDRLQVGLTLGCTRLTLCCHTDFPTLIMRLHITTITILRQ